MATIRLLQLNFFSLKTFEVSFPTKLGVLMYLVILLRPPELKKMHLDQDPGQKYTLKAIK